MLSVKICNLLQFDNTTVLIINNRVKVPSSKIFFSNFYDITKPNKKVNYLMYFIYFRFAQIGQNSTFPVNKLAPTPKHGTVL